MTNEDRDWLEAHVRGPVMARFDTVDAHIGNLRERMARVEERAMISGALAALIVAPIVTAIVVKFLQP